MKRRLLTLIGGIGVDEDRCIGCGNCEAVCPGNYELLCRGIEGRGTLVVRNGVAGFVSAECCRRDIPESACRRCYDACPMRAVIYPDSEGFQRLEAEIINAGKCTGCGACAAVCPDKIIEINEYPILRGECINCGFCLVHCPSMRRASTRGEISLIDEPLGEYRKLVAARASAARIASVAQDGGIVTALLTYALRKGIIDAAVVAVNSSQPWKPVPLIASTEEEIIAGAGTKYTNSPTLAALKKARESGFKKLGIVTLPCQSRALQRLETSELGRELMDIVALNISLFCKANLHYAGILELSQKYGFSLNEVKKFAIKGKSLYVTTPAGVVDIPLKEALRYCRPACKCCADFTSVHADISVGAVGSPKEFSTVIIRTRKAEEIFENMVKEGIIEVKEVNDKGFSLLMKLAAQKSKNTQNLSEPGKVVAMMRAGGGGH
jgi:coenzyme F420 hydrogenase subunit beta